MNVVRNWTASRSSLTSAPPRVWHTLRAEFSGRRINVTLNGKRYIQVDDAHISGFGAVGMWTKADSVTAFDDFSDGSMKTLPK